MESALRRTLIAWLRADPMLSGMLNAVEEEVPPAASPPHCAIAASASADWSHKTGRGREVRIALEIVDRGDDPANIRAIADRIEQRIATLAPQQDGWRQRRSDLDASSSAHAAGGTMDTGRAPACLGRP